MNSAGVNSGANGGKVTWSTVMENIAFMQVWVLLIKHFDKWLIRSARRFTSACFEHHHCYIFNSQMMKLSQKPPEALHKRNWVIFYAVQ